MSLRFKYLSGDFPDGTDLVTGANVLFLVLPRQGLFGRQERVKIDRNVRSVEIIGDQARQDWIEKFKRRAADVLEQSETRNAKTLMSALLAGSTEAAATLFSKDKAEVCFACRLADGRQFLAVADARIYRILLEQAAQLSAIEQWENRDFVEAVLAACALMAVSDGVVRHIEQQKLCEVILNHPAFRAYEAHALKDRFLSYCQAIAREPAAGRVWATSAVHQMRGKGEQSRALMQIAVEIGEADQPLGPHERAVVREICRELGLYPGEFGCFYTDAEKQSATPDETQQPNLSTESDTPIPAQSKPANGSLFGRNSTKRHLFE